MILDMHKAIKTALYSKTAASPDNFTTLVNSRIYDTIGPTDEQSTYCVWRFDQVAVISHFNDKERLDSNVTILTVTDRRKGVADHLAILNSLSELRAYTADVNDGIDRISFSLTNIGAIILDGKYLTSNTTFRVTSTRN
jgi:hypothetical protein